MDILQHEAHRHPYIQTLGVMYLLKLRHGDDFYTTAGSSWRLIFVYVLMPWLSKYRVIRRALPGVEDDDVSILPAPPLRAVSLVDARAHALRAVSLMPVTSGFIGGSSLGFGGFAGKDELRVLQAENRRLRVQLRLMERETLEETTMQRSRLSFTHSGFFERPDPSSAGSDKRQQTRGVTR